MEFATNTIKGQAESLQLLEEFKIRIEAKLERQEATFADFSTWAARSIIRQKRACEEFLTRKKNLGNKTDYTSTTPEYPDRQNLWTSINGEAALVKEEISRLPHLLHPEVRFEVEGNKESELCLNIHENGLENTRATENVTCYPTYVGEMDTESQVERNMQRKDEDDPSSKYSLVPSTSTWTDCKQNCKRDLFQGGTSGNSSSSGSIAQAMKNEDDPDIEKGELQSRNPSRGAIQRRHRRKKTTFAYCEYCGKKYKQLGSLKNHLGYCGNQARALLGNFQTEMNLVSGLPGMACFDPAGMHLEEQMSALENLIRTRVNSPVSSRSAFDQAIAGRQFPMRRYPEGCTRQFFLKNVRQAVPYENLPEARHHIIPDQFDDIINTPNCFATTKACTTVQGTVPTELSSRLVLLNNPSSMSPFQGFQAPANAYQGGNHGWNFGLSPTTRVMEHSSSLQPNATTVSSTVTHTHSPTSSQTYTNMSEELAQPRKIEAHMSKTLFCCVYCSAEGKTTEFNNLASIRSHVANYHLSP